MVMNFGGAAHSWISWMLLIRWYLMFEWANSNAVECNIFHLNLSRVPHPHCVHHFQVLELVFCSEASARSRYNNNDEPCLASMQFCVVITLRHTFCHFIQLNWSLRNISCIVDISHGRIWVKAKQFYKHGGIKHRSRKFLPSGQFGDILPSSIAPCLLVCFRRQFQHDNIINWNDFCITKQINPALCLKQPKRKVFIIAIKNSISFK